MSKRLYVLMSLMVFTVNAGWSNPSFAGVNDLPGLATATSMKEWLKLTDDQVAKLQPVITTRIDKVDAALATMETAEEPDAMGFVKEYGEIQKEFNAGVTNLLTPDQLKQWDSFKVELEKDLAKAGANKQLAGLQPALKLTDEQVTKLQPAMTLSVQKKLDLFQDLASTGRIGVRDKLKAKRALDGLNGELEKSMSAVMSPDQVTGYKALKEAQKEARKAKK